MSFTIKELVTAKKKSRKKVRSRSATGNSLKNAAKNLLRVKNDFEKDIGRAKKAGESTDIHMNVTKNLADMIALLEKSRIAVRADAGDDLQKKYDSMIEDVRMPLESLEEFVNDNAAAMTFLTDVDAVKEHIFDMKEDLNQI